ncbi:aromatic acid/H+ symport family MFS transporter [Sporosarcina pasteurii]|uniref:4-hydroxybenzoate transporter PcaK n=1 Tax=Sporosarcina pasteurii TaxID=1474 RepID=A0A380BYL1_SPOPA|nr:aromatic acid/H+ symport family MFS transporter [Sporosarcina pasteurii]MDS9471402.1 aromatic acid/H+ symport family MFS transporter [Sporosarcina pasteurii]QBQ04972.1 MFS transporter [Sporosarcina pasteurii]SUJ08873.1 4-hydroxybenzoate transporter PcaK [Sporosarcina pasteurii]
MNSIHVARTVDESKFNRFHGLLVFWCAFIIVFDGYDLIVYGSVVSTLMEEWSLTSVQAGTIGSYALIGMMFGAFIFAPLADRFGRKHIIIFCVVLFSLFTGLIAFSNGPTEFGIYRFIAGLGLGGAFPVTVALVTEYAPKVMRNRLVTLMLCGYGIGGILASGLAIYLIPAAGWKAMFLVGAIPLLAVPFLYRHLPESLGFLMAQKKEKEIGQVLARINPSYRPSDEDVYDISIPSKKGIPVTKLFESGRTISTLLFWFNFFLCLLITYGLGTWLPKLMSEAGYAFGSSLMFLLVLNLGGIIGSLTGGWWADHWSTKNVLTLFFTLNAISLTVMGLQPNVVILYILVAIAGATSIGSQIILYSFASQFYPTEVRSTGVGWSSGVGRIGGIIGPVVGGALLALNLPFQQNFMLLAVPGVLAAIAVAFIREKGHAKQRASVKPNLVKATSNLIDK